MSEPRRKAVRRARPAPLLRVDAPRAPSAGWLDPRPVSAPTKLRVRRMTTGIESLD